MLRTLRFINIRNETTKSTQIINVVILKNAFYFLDYAISLVRADWKGLDSLAAGRVSRVLLVCMDARKADSHSSQRIPVKDLNLAHQ